MSNITVTYHGPAGTIVDGNGKAHEVKDPEKGVQVSMERGAVEQMAAWHHIFSGSKEITEALERVTAPSTAEITTNAPMKWDQEPVEPINPDGTRSQPKRAQATEAK